MPRGVLGPAAARRARARRAAHLRCSQPGYNGRAATAAATAARQAKLEQQVDPDGQLTPEARRAAARHLRQAQLLGGKL